MTPNNNYNNRKSFRFIASIGVTFACLTASARSQESGKNSVYSFDDYVAISSKYELPIGQVGSSVELLHSYDLNARKQPFLLDSLRSIPGFYLRNNGGPGGSFGMTTRGLNSNRPVVLVNGIEVENAASGQIVNFGNLFNGGIAKVEILKGAQSSLYGANALAGVVSIDTFDGSGESGGYVDLSYGAFDTYQGGVGYSGATGDMRWSANANAFESRGYSSQNPEFGAAWADDDGYENTNISGRIEYDISEEVSVYAAAYYMDSYSEFDPGVPASVFGTPVPGAHSETEQTFLKIGSEFGIRDNWQSDASLGYANVNTSSFSGVGEDFKSSGDRVKIDWRNTLEQSESWVLVAGAEYEIEDNRSDLGDRDNFSLYGENVVNLSDRLDITVGARYDDNSVYGSETTGRGTFSYRIDESNMRFRGSYGTSFQAPTFFQLSEDFGDPNLKPESGYGWDIGIEKLFEDQKLFLSSAVFGNDIEDKIIFSFDSYRYANEDSYESYGIENAARYQATDRLSISAAHTYAKANYAGGTEAERVPRNIYSLGGRFAGVDDRLTVDLSALHVTSQFSLRGSSDKQEGYTVVNLAVQYALAEDHSVWLRVDNLFDEEYEEILSYQTPGANASIGVRLDF